MDLLVWGFVTLYLEQVTQSKAVLFMLGGIVLWDIFFSRVVKNGSVVSILRVLTKRGGDDEKTGGVSTEIR
jgi:hypothetical protein